MKIILLKDIAKLGKKDEIREVADGYALNFLIPKGLAVVASEDKIRQLEIDKQKVINRKRKEEEELNKLLDKIKDKKIIIKKKASEKGKLFAAVSTEEILTAIKKDLGVKLDKSQVGIDKHIKEVGEYKVDLLVGGRAVSVIINVIQGEM